MMRAGMRRAHLLAVIALAAACSRGDADARSRLLAQRDERPVKTLDPDRPEEAIGLSADEVASRIGSFEWTGAVEWTVARSGADAERVRVTEQHTLRQLATGEFEVGAELDPGLGPGSTTGKQIVFAGGTTYARATPAPFRARPTDRGRDARRFREESFGLARGLLALCGPALRYEPGGSDHAVGREARRHRVTLAAGAVAPQAAPRPAADTRQADPDTARRLAFLSGHVPQSAEGEVLLDAATGVPLRVRLSAAFTVRDQGDVRATVELLAQIKAIGAGVSSVAPPQGVLPDERKPAGPSTALEAAGLKKRGEERPGADGPDDEQE